jgi:hypothetical protein
VMVRTNPPSMMVPANLSLRRRLAKTASAEKTSEMLTADTAHLTSRCSSEMSFLKLDVIETNAMVEKAATANQCAWRLLLQVVALSAMMVSEELLLYGNSSVIALSQVDSG